MGACTTHTANLAVFEDHACHLPLTQRTSGFLSGHVELFSREHEYIGYQLHFRLSESPRRLHAGLLMFPMVLVDRWPACPNLRYMYSERDYTRLIMNHTQVFVERG